MKFARICTFGFLWLFAWTPQILFFIILCKLPLVSYREKEWPAENLLEYRHPSVLDFTLWDERLSVFSWENMQFVMAGDIMSQAAPCSYRSHTVCSSSLGILRQRVRRGHYWRFSAWVEPRWAALSDFYARSPMINSAPDRVAGLRWAGTPHRYAAAFFRVK